VAYDHMVSLVSPNSADPLRCPKTENEWTGGNLEGDKRVVMFTQKPCPTKMRNATTIWADTGHEWRNGNMKLRER
jgi:hypothetical protein